MRAREIKKLSGLNTSEGGKEERSDILFSLLGGHQTSQVRGVKVTHQRNRLEWPLILVWLREEMMPTNNTEEPVQSMD